MIVSFSCFRTFSHFYLSGCVCITALFVLSLYVTCGAGEWPYLVKMMIDQMRYPVDESMGDQHSFSHCSSFKFTITKQSDFLYGYDFRLYNKMNKEYPAVQTLS